MVLSGICEWEALNFDSMRKQKSSRVRWRLAHSVCEQTDELSLKNGSFIKQQNRCNQVFIYFSRKKKQKRESEKMKGHIHLQT